MIKFELLITSTKLLSFLILLIGAGMSYLLQSVEIFIFSVSVSGGLHGLKSWSDGITDRKSIDKTTIPTVQTPTIEKLSEIG